MMILFLGDGTMQMLAICDILEIFTVSIYNVK
jgi:hypothetical protein